MISKILLFLLWFSVWLLLSRPPGAQQVITAVLVALFVSLMTADMFTGKARPFMNPARYLWLLYYFIVFIWECLKANLDVAYRVIHPDAPIRPGTVKVRTSLKSDIGLTFLANSVTLTPGTTSVDIDKDRGFIYIHRLFIKDTEGEGMRRISAVERFEDILKRIFE